MFPGRVFVFSEEPGGCYCPIVILAVDFSALIAAYFLDNVGHAKTV